MLAKIPALVGVGMLLIFYGEVLSHAPATGQDFRLFNAAATVLRNGGNPYDQQQLYREEVRLYHPATAAQRASLWGNPLPEGPPLVIVLEPFVGLSADLVYKAYAALLAVAAVGALAILAIMWPIRHPTQRVLLGLISPVTFLGVMLGQPDALFLLSIVLALWLLYRKQAWWAGLVLAIGLVKPQIIAGPIVLLGLMAWRRGLLSSYALGILAGVIGFVGGSVLLAGPSAVWGWFNLLAGFGRSTIYTQVDVSSLSTLYLSWMPHALVTVLSLVTVLGWVMTTAMRWRRCDGDIDERRWLLLGLTLWLLATPYAHPHDDVLLLPVVWCLLDEGPYRGTSRWLAAALFVTWWLLPMTSVLGLRPPLVRGLGIVPVLLLAALVMLRRAQCASRSSRDVPRPIVVAGAGQFSPPVIRR